ncbi:TPA: serine dehydratase [Candidatus Acetothermia bacterium]|nr:serine dehydratase [Candidatus Acetothermia bacterium]
MSDPWWEQLSRARDQIGAFVHRTPVMTCAAIDRVSENTVFFKCENLQRTGSFKFRGALNAILSLSLEKSARGVITHSSGNHAQAVALAAKLHGVRSFVVIPQDAPMVKREATEDYGATIILCEPTYASREQAATRIIKETGAVFVDPHDDLRVIAGQGTAAVELVEETGPLDLLLVPVGGGGLLAGTAIAAAHLFPRAKVIGCEPAGADDAYRSFNSGRRVTEFTPRTIADGLRTPLGEQNFEIIMKRVHDIVRVSEEEILGAMRFIWERMKLVIEPSSAVAVAPLLNHSLDVIGERVGVILSGGNVDLDRFFQLF